MSRCIALKTPPIEGQRLIPHLDFVAVIDCHQSPLSNEDVVISPDTDQLVSIFKADGLFFNGTRTRFGKVHTHITNIIRDAIRIYLIDYPNTKSEIWTFIGRWDFASGDIILDIEKYPETHTLSVDPEKWEYPPILTTTAGCAFVKCDRNFGQYRRITPLRINTGTKLDHHTEFCIRDAIFRAFLKQDLYEDNSWWMARWDGVRSPIGFSQIDPPFN